MDTLKQRILKILAKFELTQAQLCQRLNISDSAVSQWLDGSTKSIKGENVVKLSREFGLSPDWLVSGKGGMFEGDSQAMVTEESIALHELSSLFLRSDERGRDTILTLAKHEAGRNSDLGLPQDKHGEPAPKPKFPKTPGPKTYSQKKKPTK
ncbi:MAG: helix-turn-helix transcriptional regulator, partial [Candidatus Thiodiazotropha endolucinida]